MYLLFNVVHMRSKVLQHFRVCSFNKVQCSKDIDDHECSKLSSISTPAEELFVEYEVCAKVDGKHFKVSEVGVLLRLNDAAL